MKRFRRWTIIVVVFLAAMAAGFAGTAWIIADRQLNRVYVVADPPLAVPQDADSLAYGRHLFVTRGCADCHGEDGRGLEVLDAPGVMRLVGPNITPKALQGRYDADAIAAAIRHGIKPDGRPLIFMPSWDWQHLSDADTAALVAYIQSLAPSAHDPGRIEIRLMARILNLFGQFPLTPADQIDHSPRQRAAPAVAVSVEYGRYLAGTCIGCHGPDLAGQRVPGTPPDIPPAPSLHATADALGAWSESDFNRALREGRAPDGREFHPIMPWHALKHMTEVEVAALWVYLRTLE